MNINLLFRKDYYRIMFTMQIDQSIINKFTEFIHKSEYPLTSLQVNRQSFIIRKQSFGENGSFKIGLGYGDYLYMYKKSKIYIEFTEEGVPRPSYHTRIMDYYKRFILKAECLDILKDLCKTVLTDIDESEKLNIYISTKDGYWDLYSKIPQRDLKSVYIDDKIKTKLVSDISHFISQEEEYHKFGIPYKRVYLLTGIPGSGKTSIIKSLCNHFKFNLSILTVCKGFDNNSLMSALKDVKKNTIILIEDIDSLFNKRESTSDNTSITFSSLLNVLDGVLYRTGNIIFLTTNHPANVINLFLNKSVIDSIFFIIISVDILSFSFSFSLSNFFISISLSSFFISILYLIVSFSFSSSYSALITASSF